MTEPERLDAEMLQARARDLAKRQRPEPEPPSPPPPDQQAQIDVAKARLAEADRKALEARWAEVVPPKFRSARLGDFDAEVRGQLERWIKDADDGANLAITGPTGTGKTHAAFAACRVLFGRHLTVQFWPVLRLARALDYHDPDYKQQKQLFEGVCTTNVLVLDDLGLGDSDWMRGRLFDIVGERWMADLPTVSTTNMPWPELNEMLGDRTFSRLLASAVAVRLTGGDRRATAD